MTAYAIAQLRQVDQNAEIVDYLLRIDNTLIPYSGQFLVHGSVPDVVDGELPGVLVVIGFPDLEHAHGWYDSPGYQAIAPLRIRNSDGGAVIVDGVPEGYLASSIVSRIRS